MATPEMIDTHNHLDMDEFREDLDEVVERAVSTGVARMITVGIDYASSQRAVGLSHRFAAVYAAVGCHPHHAGTAKEEDLDLLAELSSCHGVVAWGEIGLDFFYRHSSPEEQTSWFSAQLERAHELDLPVIVHDRDAHEETLGILKRMGKGEKKGVIHCFSGDKELAMAFIDLGYSISIPGTVTYKKASNVRETASQVPIDSLLIETDAPFLSPAPMRGKRNEPAFVLRTAEEIARLRRMDVEEVARQTSENAKTLFRLPAKS